MARDIEIPQRPQFLPPVAKVYKHRFLRSVTSSGAVRVWRTAHEESAEGLKAFHPSPNCGPQWQTTYQESFGSRKCPHPPCAPKRNAHTLAEIYNSKKDQSIFPSVKKPTTHHLTQTSPPQDSTSTKALRGKREAKMINKPKAPAPPTVPRRGCVLRPAKQETLENLMAFEPGMTFSGGTQKVKFVPPHRAPRRVTSHLTTSIQSPTTVLFADKYRRTEHQIAFGPKFRTAQFDAVLFRQLRGLA